jgi:hypothetical protein
METSPGLTQECEWRKAYKKKLPFAMERPLVKLEKQQNEAIKTRNVH